MHHSQQHISKQFSSSSQEVVQQQTQQQFMSQQRVEQSFSRQVTHHQTQQRGQFNSASVNMHRNGIKINKNCDEMCAHREIMQESRECNSNESSAFIHKRTGRT